MNDIALIKLPRRAELNDLVKMACLPAYIEDLRVEFKVFNEHTDFVGQKSSVVGWGKTDPLEQWDGVGSKTQQFVEVMFLTMQVMFPNNFFRFQY